MNNMNEDVIELLKDIMADMNTDKTNEPIINILANNKGLKKRIGEMIDILQAQITFGNVRCQQTKTKKI